MAPRDPLTRLSTHEVTNQPPPLENTNLFDGDAALKEGLAREGGEWARERVRAFGALMGEARVIDLGEQANRYVPELRAFDRFGRRIDEVAYHPAYHALMDMAFSHAVPSIAWTADRPGGHVVHVALEYLLIQAEAGVCCPVTMTYAGVAALRHQPEIAAEWEPRVTAGRYDPRAAPVEEKAGATLGMAMTEKQGGSDVRANSTRATPLGDATGPGAAYTLTGHKWFCSAPMSDAFLTLAYTDKGLSCFLVPRWTPEGTRNAIRLLRLKDKLGNRSNASAEIEYEGAFARMVGEEGRGVRTIMEMVNHTRLDCVLAPAGLMRQALVQALHHTAHRTAFQRLLSQQPLMKNVLADLAVEVEAATAMALRLARAFDEGNADPAARGLGRLGVAVGKYWINKRAQGLIYEAMECLGGGGYVEESILPRLYREAPVNSIWEGSGNVICLDVLRVLAREPEAVRAFVDEVEAARGGDRRLDRALDDLKDALADKAAGEAGARRLTERLARALQGALLVRHAPAAVADAFCASRLAGEGGRDYGTLPPGLAFDEIIERARPEEAA